MSYCPQCFSFVENRQGIWCKPCKAALMRKNRVKYANLPIDERIKSIARSSANVAQKRGKIEVGSCRQCGGNKAQKHHNDYGKPLEVIWLCRRCHIMLHKRESMSEKIEVLKRCLELIEKPSTIS